ncbi:XrtA/PEP-CTERM system histidine kinase PrsK [Undibacterium sp. RuTC16W]|uniref:XrtA/PEP-CTERM system histidine kinase PrsK n=1 Tax=Undibacterium sp. RuTC16W TaxID=3413048 RepID=UPI003BF3CE7A
MLISVVSLSYLVAAFAFLILSVVLMTKWRGRLHWKTLAAACIITTSWAATLAFHILFGLPLSTFANALEIARSASWIIFLLILLHPQTSGNVFTWVSGKPYKQVILIFLGALFFSTIYAHSTISDPLSAKISLIADTFGRVALAVMGLLLVEQFFRNMSDQGRWGIKFACLGIGGLFAYDFYLYSDAMLFRTINPEIWAARGLVDAISVPLIAISVARNPKWSLGILVSRRMLFHSATLFGAAFYLLAMAAAGYYLRFFGGNWGTVMQVAFLFGAIILLVVLLFSGSVRSWLKVFISKHFYNYNYDYREEWIRFTRTLSIGGDDLGERVIRALASLVESPAGVLFVRRESGLCEPVNNWNMPLGNSTEPVNSAFSKLLEEKQWVVDLSHADDQTNPYAEVTIPEWLQHYPKAWLVLPLIFNGKLFGFILLAEARSKIKLNWEVLDLLKIAGVQAASYLAQEQSANALMVARQFESFNRMSTFMVHDLKNLVAQLSLLLSNAEKHKDNPEFQKDMVDTIDHSVQKMKVLLQKLSRGASVDKLAVIPLDALLRHAVDSKSPYEPTPKLEINSPDVQVFANRERLERVIGHLIQNAIEATPKQGEVHVKLSQQHRHAVIEIKDTGVGMSEEFIRDKLFSPFVSTKVAGMGIGVFETKEYIDELGGKLEIMSRVSVGTSFKIILPGYFLGDTHALQDAQIQKVTS